MDLGKYRAITKPLKIDLGDGDVLNLTYRPNVLSLGDSREDRENMSHEDRAEEFLRLVASWDLEFEPGKPVPLTTEALMDVPLVILVAIDQGLAGALIPSEEEKGGVIRAYGMAFRGLYSAYLNLPADVREWVDDFRIADRLRVSPHELEAVPLVWVERTKIMLEIEESEKRAVNARRN